MAEHKPTILRLSQKELTRLFESGDAKVVKPESDNLVKKEKAAWEKFLGPPYGLFVRNPPPELFEVMERAKAKGITSFEPHFFPKITFSKVDTYPGWKKKPNDWYWETIDKELIPLSALVVDGQWILIDTTQKPNYHYGGLMFYENDSFASFLPNKSRFRNSWAYLNQVLLPYLATKIGIHNNIIRLPKEIEFNVLGNIYHSEWGITSTREWFADKVDDSNCLIGGYGSRLNSGLGEVQTGVFDTRYDDVGFRPMIIFPPVK